MGTGLSHSKSVAIAKQGFLKKPYFSDRRFSKEDIQLLFTLRTRMLACKSNFESLYQNNMTCRACNDITSLEDKNHILTCSVLYTEEHGVQFSDVYGNPEEQFKAIKTFKKILRKRKVYLDIS